MLEIWKEVVGYEGLYQVSNFGKVKSKNKILNGYINKKGYRIVTLYKKSKIKLYKVSRLVYLTFNKISYENQLTINHIDFNKLNDNIDNLELISASKNTKYSWENNRYSTKKQVYLIKNNNKILFQSHRDLSKELGHSENYISTKLFKNILTVTYKDKKTIYKIERKEL